MSEKNISDETPSMRTLSVSDTNNSVAIDVFMLPASSEPYRVSVRSMTTGVVTEFRFDADGKETGHETIMDPTPSREFTRRFHIVK
jgi:hypothetical protein